MSGKVLGQDSSGLGVRHEHGELRRRERDQSLEVSVT